MDKSTAVYILKSEIGKANTWIVKEAAEIVVKEYERLKKENQKLKSQMRNRTK